MVITKLSLNEEDGWYRFNLNVGGFTIHNCRWHPPTRRIFFPRRYNLKNRRPRKVIHAYGAQVKRLRSLLESGQARSPRDRRPCILKIHGFGSSSAWCKKEHVIRRWLIFNFTVRGFTVLGCRWQVESGSIQLPVTYVYRDHQLKKPVVCASGPHINRLRAALEAAHSKIAALAA